jgi:PAS domain S-box-containing protein
MSGTAAARGIASTPREPQSDGKGVNLFRLLVDSVRDYAIFMLDPEGRVSTWNAGAENIKGYRKEEVLGKHFSIFYTPDAIARRFPQYELEMARERGRFEDEGWRLRKDGSKFWANVVITAVRDEQGTLRGFAKVTRDLTARRQVEELQRSERLMNEFLAMLAHELRNPLAPIQTSLDLIELRPDDRQTTQWAHDVIARQTRQLARLVDDLLDVSRITQGKITLRPQNVDLRAIVTQVAQAWKGASSARQQTLDVVLPAEPMPVHADPTRLEQVLSNLVSNAVKFTPDNGTILLRGQVNAGIASVTVSDTGIGIPPDLLMRVFDLFVQGERSLDRPEGGLGIGLTLAKRLVDAMGGTLTAASPGTGQGSEFALAMPVVQNTTLSQVASAPREAPVVSSRQVLVVDDNHDAADALAALLEALGHHARIAYDGPTALKMATDDPPDVMLVDIGLPDMNGYDLLRRLRELSQLTHTRFVACTGYGRPQDIERFGPANFDAYLVKPVDAADLERALEP